MRGRKVVCLAIGVAMAVVTCQAVDTSAPTRVGTDAGMAHAFEPSQPSPK
jgi:hypothetical protein